MDTNILAAQAPDPIFFSPHVIFPSNPILMAPQDFSRTNLVIFPQLSFTGGTFDD
jgi:hypothetical protein